MLCGLINKTKLNCLKDIKAQNIQNATARKATQCKHENEQILAVKYLLL